MEHNKQDIDGLGHKLNGFMDTQEKRYTELSMQIGHVSEVLTRMEVRMSSMVETIQEMKKEIIPRELLLRLQQASIGKEKQVLGG